MQENEFEKRVQQEMAEFRLRPSDAVWEKVEEQLKKKKRRRVVFVILMLAGLSLLGYSGYFLTITNSKQNLVQQNNTFLPDSEKSIPGNKQEASPAIENVDANDQPGTKEYQLPQTKEKERTEESGNDLNNEKVIITGNNIPGKQKERIRKISSGNYAITKSTRENHLDPTKVNSPEKKTKIQLQDNPLYPPADKTDISQADITNDLEDENKINGQKGNEPLKADSVIAAGSKVDEAIAATKKKEPASKIKWGIDLSAGISSSRNSAFSIFDMNKSMAMDSYSPGSATGGGGLGPIRISPSDIQAGPAFRAGILGEMKLSKKSSISSGLQYVYYSNRIEVGYYSDTTLVVNNSFSQSSRVDAIYRGTHQKEYTNRYHFIQIPLQYQLQLNKGVKLPILWSIGASAGYLFATNGLVYDTAAGGIYYRDNAAFNKFQVNLNTGFSFRFGNTNKVQWSLGPELSLGLNKLMKDEYTKKQYLLYGGLTGRLYFKKRNNK